jgi:hypothetical protein
MSDQPRQNKRGPNAEPGMWITLEEALNRSCGFSKRKEDKEKWWTMPSSDSSTVPVRQYDNDKHTGGPPDNPVWLYRQGDMYLGEWVTVEKNNLITGERNVYPMEHGFGISFNAAPSKFRGLVYVGQWQMGRCYDINGKSMWLESALTWRNNSLSGSPIRQGSVGLPFNYVGPYDEHEMRSGEGDATVSLKDDTVGVGKWMDGKPVGNFWKDHVVARMPTPLAVPMCTASAAGIHSVAASGHVTKKFNTKRTRSNKPTPVTRDGDYRARKTSTNHRTSLYPLRRAKMIATEEVDDERKLPAGQLAFAKIIEIESSDDDAEPLVPRNLAAATPLPCLPVVGGAASLRPATVRSTGSDQHLEDITDTIENIAAWLVSTIGYDFNDLELARSYARNFIAIGADSVRMIVGECLESDVDECVNKPIHQRRINKALALVNNPK